MEDLELPDQDGNRRRLSELAAGDPCLLVFFRGWWCPKEQRYMRLLVGLQDEIEVAYSRIVSVSVDPPATQAAFRAGLGARWTFLSDQERRYIDALGLRELTDTVHEPYAPTVLMLRPGLVVHDAWNGYWFWGRPTMEELRESFRAVTREIRPDWVPPRDGTA